jgi:hypothetical protein
MLPEIRRIFSRRAAAGHAQNAIKILDSICAKTELNHAG